MSLGCSEGRLLYATKRRQHDIDTLRLDKYMKSLITRPMTLIGALLLALSMVGTAAASSHVLYEQDFSTDASGWLDSDTGWYGSVTHNTTDETATFEGGDSGPFSRFDGYRDVWPGDYIAEIDVLLDPAWGVGEGFDYSVASSGSDGSHQRDFIFHVGVHADGRLLVNGSNNTDFVVNDFKLLNDGDATPYEVVTAGWYTLQHVFYDEGGQLAVDLNVIDDNGTTVFTTTRTNPADTISSEVGGNRYAWFNFISVANGIDVDNHKLSLVVDPPPAPETIDECKKGGFEAFGFENQGQCVASVKANEQAGK